MSSRHNPEHVSRDGYITKSKWLAKKFVVLWDEESKRGWLVNGTSALLHLLRAYLEACSTDAFSSLFLYKKEEMQEAAEPYTARSALEVLIDKRNWNIKLYPDKDDFLYLVNQLEKYCDILERLIQHQIDLASQSGIDVKPRLRKHLEGWDFNDIAAEEDPFRMRVATIKPLGKGWVDFIRDIEAVTLLGRGFGEILRRPVSSDPCERWITLPSHEYYLAACASDLKKIMIRHGNPSSMNISKSIAWHHPENISETCRCKGDRQAEHTDRVQLLLPQKFRNRLPSGNPFLLEDDVAVIFGHNSKFNWIYRDIGDPEEGPLPARSADSENYFHDSGLGSSEGPSAATESIRQTESRSQHTWSEESSRRHETSGPATSDRVDQNKIPLQRSGNHEATNTQQEPSYRGPRALLRNLRKKWR